MRILQVNKLYYPWVGGVEKIVKSIAEGLNNKVSMRVLVCQPRGRYINQNVNGVNVFRASSIGILRSMPVSPDFFFHFVKLTTQTDIVHFHVPFPLGEVSFLISKPKVKAIAWWHSEIVRQKFFLKAYKKLLKRFLDSVSAIIVATPNHILYSELLKNYENKCEIIPFGIDVRKYELSPQMKEKVALIRKVYGPRIVLSVGRMVYYKGFEYLISAMKDVDAKLLLIGNGPLKHKLVRYAHKMKLTGKIFFIDNVSDEELPVYYHSCDVFVLPSVEKTEAFGIVQLEAMACGKPVINTNLPTGVPFVSVHGETGLTVSPRDSLALSSAINYLFQNPEIMAEFGIKAALRAKEKFDLFRMLEKVYSLYRKVLEGSEF